MNQYCHSPGGWGQDLWFHYRGGLSPFRATRIVKLSELCRRMSAERKWTTTAHTLISKTKSEPKEEGGGLRVNNLASHSDTKEPQPMGVEPAEAPRGAFQDRSLRSPLDPQGKVGKLRVTVCQCALLAPVKWSNTFRYSRNIGFQYFAFLPAPSEKTPALLRGTKFQCQ